MTFAEKIRTARKNTGLTQQELAKAVGVSGRAAAAYELEGAIARKKVIRKLARVLNVSYDYLFHDEVTDPFYLISAMDSIDTVLEALGEAAADDYDELLQKESVLFAGGRISTEVETQHYAALARAYIGAANRYKRKGS